MSRPKQQIAGGPAIYFLCPDLDIPSGGINRLYRLAQVTASGGYGACVLHEKQGFVNRWSPVQPPIKYWGKGMRFKPGDVVVIPESEPAAMRQLPGELRKVVLALDWSYIFENLPRDQRWVDFGICHVLTCSGVIQDFIEWSMHLPVTRIEVPVDRNRFSYDPRQKKRRVVYMAHRNDQGEWIEKIFRQLPRPVPQWKWRGVRGLGMDQYAAVMRQAQIFVATGLREGVPGPILEAMASGTVVVGYGGVGGNEYIMDQGVRQNAFRVENGDYFALGRVLEQVLPMVENEAPLVASIRQNGLETVRPLTFEAERTSLLQFWEQFLNEGSHYAL